MADHGTRTRFNQGCAEGPNGTACDACKKANRDYFNKRNLEKKAQGTKGKPPAASPSSEPGPMEVQTAETLADLPNAQRYPELATAALMVAKDLDNPLAIGQRSNLLKQWREIMTELRKGSEKKGKLSLVRQMSQPKAG